MPPSACANSQRVSETIVSIQLECESPLHIDLPHDRSSEPCVVPISLLGGLKQFAIDSNPR